MSEQQQNTKSRFVTSSYLCKELGICQRTLERWINAGKFPAPLRLGLRKRVWLRTEYETHITALAAEKEKNHA